MSEETEEFEETGIDLEELGKRYEAQGFFSRLAMMMSGLGKPHDTREYRLARIELQRLAAPLIAIVSVSMFVVVAIILTLKGPEERKLQNFQAVDLEIKEAEVEEEPEPEPPPDIEPPPEDVEIQIDNPTPGPVSNLTPVAAPPATQVSVKPATQDSVAIIDSPVKMKSMTGSRNPGSIGALTSGGAGYGDPTTEATVMKVLWYLKAHQNSDGSWRNKEGSQHVALSDTALALLTYLAHGEYPGSPSPYRKDFGPAVEQGVQYIISCLEPNGKTVKMKGADGNEYAFLIATYALCEAYGMTKNPNCKEVAMQTLKRIIDGQSPTGGWDYKINPQSTRDDLSFAGWALQALKAGKMAGMHPEGLEDAIKKAIKCLKTRSFRNDHFTYVAGSNQHPGLTATGCLAMQLLGYGSEPEVKKSLDFMREWHPGFEAADANVGKDCPNPQYYCYYATQCKYQAGMKQGALKNDETTWHNWNKAMKALYPKSITDCPETVKDWTGKDHKQGYFKCSKDNYTGDIMSSCLVALQLMVYYRYLPTSQVSASAAEETDAGEAAVDKGSDVDVTVDI